MAAIHMRLWLLFIHGCGQLKCGAWL